MRRTIRRAQRARSLSSAAAPIPFPDPPRLKIMPGSEPTPAGRTRLLQCDSAQRKRYPLYSGLLAYFPDACAAVAEISVIGNDKHNPGQPLHWARGKSMDHLDCIVRHAVEAGQLDHTDERVRHSANLAWRALANLQEELERVYGLALPPGATTPDAN